jgi:hypothetical protein
LHSNKSLSASKAYSEIVDALRNASTAAETAQTNAEQARNLVDKSSSDSMVNLANATLKVSHELEKTVVEAKEKDDYVNKTNGRLREILAKLKSLALKANENITRIKSQFT